MQSLRRGQSPRGRDPAPSRLRYRLQRLWLTRSFRKLAIFGPPVAILGAALSYAFAGVWGKRFLSQYPPIMNAFGMLVGSHPIRRNPCGCSSPTP